MREHTVKHPNIVPTGIGKYMVRSSDGVTWYGVIDGQCECKGFAHRQKCRHIKLLIDNGYLSPEEVEGYFRNQTYPPVKLGDPVEEYTRYPIWSASYHNLFLAANYERFFRVGVEKKPYKLFPFGIDAYYQSVIPDESIQQFMYDDPELFVNAYRKQLNAIGPDKVATYLANCKLQAGGRNVILLSVATDVTGRDGFADPRRVFTTWFYERTKQVIPEIRRSEQYG